MSGTVRTRRRQDVPDLPRRPVAPGDDRQDLHRARRQDVPAVHVPHAHLRQLRQGHRGRHTGQPGKRRLICAPRASSTLADDGVQIGYSVPRDVPLVQRQADRPSGSYSLGTHPPHSGLSMATGSLSASSTNTTTRSACGTAATATSCGNSTTMAHKALGDSINDVPVDESERRISGPRPESGRGQPFPIR
jgi:hypothetical protein